MKFTFVLLLGFSLSFLSAQCPPNNLTFFTQTNVNTFVSNANSVGGCPIVPGNFTIGPPSGVSNITDISGIDFITEVGGNLIIQNTSLASLDGLQNLTSVGGDLTITSNGVLANIADLEAAVLQSSSVEISSNAMLGDCAITPICAAIDDLNVTVTVSGNTGDCATLAAVDAVCPACHPDFAALMSIYNAMDGANWTNNSGWSDGAAGMDCNVCDWFGVSCGFGMNPRVEAINLQYNGLSGSIPNGITGLSELVSLIMAGPGISGPFPAAVTQLATLESLALRDGNFTTNIPSNIEDLSNLTSLNLGNNNIPGIIPISIGNLTNLISLNLSGNDLTGSIPSQLGNLTNLFELALSSNELTGSIPGSFVNLTSLEELFLQANDLTGVIPDIWGGMTVLETVNFTQNDLTGSIPASLASQNSLVSLRLSQNFLSGAIPAALASLTNLEILNLAENQLTGSIPDFGTGQPLTFLALSDNDLVGNIPVSIGNATNLEILYLGNNDLTGALPASLGNLINLVQLFTEDNDLSGCYPPSYAAICTAGTTTRFFGNAGLLDGGSPAGWDHFCATGTGCQCPDFPLELTTNAEIVAFGANYPFCTTLPGNLRVIGSSITSLSGLDHVEFINGNLAVYDADIPHLFGLRNVTEVTGQLTLQRMDMPRLMPAAGRSSAMASMALTTVGSDIYLEEMYGLLDFTGWENLTSVPEIVAVEDTGIEDLTGLSNLTSINELYFEIVPNLESLSGFPAAITSLDRLYINEADVFEDFTALDPILTSLGELFISGAPLLTDLSGLEQLTINTDLTLRFTDVANCAIESFCNAVADNAVTKNIGNNGGVNCNSIPAVAAACLALPVDWLDFSATLTSEKVVDLYWVTAVEVNNDYFAIERSRDGSRWVTIGTVNAATDDNGNGRYTYSDTAPLAGTNFYRLRQIDFDGGFSFSPVRQIEISGTNKVAIFPNPAREMLTIELPDGRNDEVQVFDLNGKEVLRFPHPGGRLRMDLTGFVEGIYLVRIKGIGALERVVIHPDL